MSLSVREREGESRDPFFGGDDGIGCRDEID